MIRHVIMIDGQEYDYDERGYEKHDDGLGPARAFTVVSAIEAVLIIAFIVLWRMWR